MTKTSFVLIFFLISSSVHAMDPEKSCDPEPTELIYGQDFYEDRENLWELYKLIRQMIDHHLIYRIKRCLNPA